MIGINIDTSVDKLPRISKRIIPSLRRLGIRTIRDMLFHFPSRYDDFSNEKKICDISEGETVTVRGEIKKILNHRAARKNMILTEATVEDSTGPIKAVWFRQPYLLRNLRVGAQVNLSGKVARGPKGIYLQNPVYEKIPHSTFHNPNSQGIHTGGLVAVYPETSGITSRWLRYLIKSHIAFASQIPDPLPDETRKKYQLPLIKEALFSIHFPSQKNEASRARRRFGFQSVLLIQLRGLQERFGLKKEKAPAIALNLPLVKEFVNSLSFSLTDAQRRSLWEILQDFAKPFPMNRLLEGDVGSGKTVVAAASTLAVIKAGYRVACMAPTEILARQHYATFERLLGRFNIRIGLALGAEKKFSDETDLVVGTHALIQKNLRIEKLGLVIIDEQHRFGVEQRAALQKQDAGIKNQGGEEKSLIHESRFLIPHFLSMSATPIPRTLALTVYGDLDLSLLDEMPKTRKPVITRVVEPREREATYQFIGEEVEKGRQVFVICPRIEPSQKQDIETAYSQKSYADPKRLLLWEVKAVTQEHKRLSEEVFPDFKIAMLHGKIKSKEKDAIMKKFQANEYHILVSTSVVEVGVDIPNATVMMIEGAERFGLAQLHQFRGRVGRGAEQSYCFLFPTDSSMASRRLQAVVEARNGFELAEKDLEIRGPGDLLGKRQSGISDETLASLSDLKLVRETRREAVEIMRKSPDLSRYPLLRSALKELEKDVHPE